MNTPESFPVYTSLIPDAARWKNRLPARSLWAFATYSPAFTARSIDCQTLLIAAEHDSLIPVKAVGMAAEKISNATLVEFPIGHFDIYQGEYLQKMLDIEVDFLKKNLSQK